jgi:N-formylglutamate deformylase
MTGAVVELEEGDGPVVATAIHDGHAVRREVFERLALDEMTRLHEEDPYTGQLTKIAATRLVALRSRFEVDLNRPRDQAVYRVAADAWGLEVWRDGCPDSIAERSLAEYDEFYAVLERVLRDRVRRYGRFVVLDLHSYNHRRGGPEGPAAPPEENPEINLGTESVDKARWGSLVSRFVGELRAEEVRGHRLDVRENVKFMGGAMAQWVHRTFPETGVALAIELKKTFMDEWTGQLSVAHLAELRRALAATVPGLMDSLGR